MTKAKCPSCGKKLSQTFLKKNITIRKKRKTQKRICRYIWEAGCFFTECGNRYHSMNGIPKYCNYCNKETFLTGYECVPATWEPGVKNTDLFKNIAEAE